MSNNQRGKPAPRGARKLSGQPASAKVDIYEINRHEYVTPKVPQMLDVNRGTYVAIAGRGEPDGDAFTTALGALYNVAYTVKMARKVVGSDFTVSKLEGLWWATRGKRSFLAQPRATWHWRLLIRVPDFVTPGEVDDSIDRLAAKGKPKQVRGVALEHLHEGRCVQMLHIGPYANETESIDQMRLFTEEQGLGFSGTHHEIYLSDPRRVAPARLRTILRIPVAKRPA